MKVSSQPAAKARTASETRSWRRVAWNPPGAEGTLPRLDAFPNLRRGSIVLGPGHCRLSSTWSPAAPLAGGALCFHGRFGRRLRAHPRAGGSGDPERVGGAGHRSARRRAPRGRATAPCGSRSAGRDNLLAFRGRPRWCSPPTWTACRRTSRCPRTRTSIRGRGSCDAKGLAAAMVAAAERWRQAARRRIGLLFLVGEENGSDGARVAAGLEPRGRFLINGEPTENRLSMGQKGSLRVDLDATGRAGPLRLSRRGAERHRGAARHARAHPADAAAVGSAARLLHAQRRAHRGRGRARTCWRPRRAPRS